MKNRKSEAGFTLIEMMVVAGVVSVLAIGFASYMYQQAKNLRAGETRENGSQLQLNVLSVAGKPDGLIQSEGLQKLVYPTVVIPCDPPCHVAPDEGNGPLSCVYDCRIPALSMSCTTLGPECHYIYLHQCGCGATSGRTTL